MNVRARRALIAGVGLLACMAPAPVFVAAQNGGAPVIVVETTKGTFSFATYPDEAPRTVKHILDLVQSGFYDGQRFHRAIPGFVVQWGDPQSRDPSKEAIWGRGAAAASGHPVGVAESTKKHTHTAGAVGISHPGNPALADSQIYVTLANRDDLNGRYTVFGHLVSGREVVDAIQRGDVVSRMYVKE